MPGLFESPGFICDIVTCVLHAANVEASSVGKEKERWELNLVVK